MNFSNTEPDRVSEMKTDARLAALHTELCELIKQKSGQAVQVAQDYCALAEMLNNLKDSARGNYLLAQAFLQCSELRKALEAAEISTHYYVQLNDYSRQAEVQALAGKINLSLGDFDAAETQLRYAISLVKNGSSTYENTIYATALNHLAGVQYNRGYSTEAILILETALRMWEHLDNKLGRATCLTNIGSIQSAIGQYHSAIGTLGRAYEIYKTEINDPQSEGFILVSLSRAHSLDRNYILAIEVANSALHSARLSGDDVLFATASLNLGTFYLDIGEYNSSKEYLISSLRLSHAIGHPTCELSAYDSLGMLYQKTTELPAARKSHLSALSIAIDIEYLQGQLDARLHLGAVELTLGDLKAAHEQLSLALALATESESPKEEAEAHRLLADLAQRQGEYKRAFEHSQEHLRIKDELFNVERDRQTRNLSIQFEVERARHDADVYRIRTEVEQEARIAAEQLVQERTADLARAQHEVVNRLAMAAEYRDDTTGEHTRRVGRTAARIARALGWSEDRARILGIAARLHDVGKIGIPDSILLKAGRLTDSEFDQMKTHTLIGSRILSGGRSELLRLAEEIAYSHHERWDGGGYPRGLRGEEIPLTGRIVALADVFDALTQARPYKAAWTVQEALAEVQRQSGSHFDPEVVGTALRLLMPTEGQAGLQSSVHFDDVMLDEEDASHILSVFEQLLVERTRDAELARQETERVAGELARLTITDSLTGLPNRRAFETDLEAVFGQEGAAPSVISFDLDGLKRANDTLGHGQGDALLQRFAGSMESHFAAVGRAYRIGGDEFAVIGVNPADDPAVTELLRRTLAESTPAGSAELGVSMGIARAPMDARTPGDLLRESDRRMYADKLSRRAGR